MNPLINPRMRGMKAIRSMTGAIRVMPDFLIIGGNRCGTTTLYRHLCQHPCVAPAYRSEVLFFDLNFAKGLTWYKTHFVTAMSKYATKLRHQRFLTGEGTTYYLFHPHAPRRVLQTLPGVKLIVLLRNPVDRAYSQYQQKFRRGRETLSFEEAINAEPDRLAGEREKMLANEHYNSIHHRDHAYQARGIYVDQLMHWMSFFPREKMLIFSTQDLRDNPANVLKQSLKFLELPDWQPDNYNNYNTAEYAQMDPRMRTRLSEFFKPHNQRLYDFLGRDFGWDQ